jgi:hypothetical protein
LALFESDVNLGGNSGVLGALGVLAAGPTMYSGPLVNPAIVVPVGVVAMLVLAGHVLSLQYGEMPASRRRVRIANGLVMLFTAPLVTYAFGFATPAEPRVFATVWMLVSGLLMIVLGLATVDVLNTYRILFLERSQLRRALRKGMDAARGVAS